MAKNESQDKNIHWLKKLAVGMGAIALLSIGSVATVAAFTSTATTSISASAGTVLLKVNDVASTSVNFGSNLKPDGIKTADQTVRVKNTGTLPLNFTVKTAAGSGRLAEALDLTLKAGAATTYISKLNLVDTPSYSVAVGGFVDVMMSVKWTSTASDDTYQGAVGDTVLNFVGTQQ